MMVCKKYCPFYSVFLKKPCGPHKTNKLHKRVGKTYSRCIVTKFSVMLQNIHLVIWLLQDQQIPHWIYHTISYLLLYSIVYVIQNAI